MTTMKSCCNSRLIIANTAFRKVCIWAWLWYTLTHYMDTELCTSTEKNFPSSHGKWNNIPHWIDFEFTHFVSATKCDLPTTNSLLSEGNFTETAHGGKLDGIHGEAWACIFYVLNIYNAHWTVGVTDRGLQTIDWFRIGDIGYSLVITMDVHRVRCTSPVGLLLDQSVKNPTAESLGMLHHERDRLYMIKCINNESDRLGLLWNREYPFTLSYYREYTYESPFDLKLHYI